MSSRNTILFDATFRRMVVFLLCRGCVGIWYFPKKVFPGIRYSLVFDLRIGRLSRVFPYVRFCSPGDLSQLFGVLVASLMALFIWFKSLKSIVRYYHFANFAGLLLFVALWHWIPQQFNAAFFPLVLVLVIRSFTYLAVSVRLKKTEKNKDEK